MELIENIMHLIPQLLMYFIPGYISLEIRRNNRQENKYIDRDLVILSITYSFIIGMIVFLIDMIPIINIEELDYECKVVIKISIAILFGFAITVYPETNLAKYVRKLLKCNAEPYSNVWNLAMKNPKGAWARVYLENENILYVGMLINYTCDPDEERKEILLSGYSSYNICNNSCIENFEGDEKATVYINADDVKRIEIFREEP